MKPKFVIAIIVSLCINSTINAQSASVIIARKNNSCGERTDIGYLLSTDLSSNALKVQDKILEKYPDLIAIELIGLDENKIGESILVIISGTTEEKNCDKRITYGVGYAKNRENALKKAISWLNIMNNDWDEVKDGYQVVLEKDFSNSKKVSSYSEKAVVTGL